MYKALLLLFISSVSLGEEQSQLSDNLKTLTRLINDCGQQEDSSVCFKMKAVSFLDRLIRAPSQVPITQFVSLTKDPSIAVPEDNQTESTVATEEQLQAALPRSLSERSRKLDDMLWSKFFTLISSRKLEFNLPTDLFEGRDKKKKKKGGGMMMAAMMGGMMMKMAMGGIGLLAGKALLVGKIALVLALIMAFKKMGGGGGGAEMSHPQVVYGPPENSGGGHGGYRRYIDAQNLAYATHTEDYLTKR